MTVERNPFEEAYEPLGRQRGAVEIRRSAISEDGFSELRAPRHGPNAAAGKEEKAWKQILLGFKGLGV